MEHQLRKLAKELLETKAVNVVIGYRPSALEGLVTPAFVSEPNDVDSLVWNNRCYHNLARYLTKPEVKARGRVAIVAKGCDVASVIGLISENQVKRENVVIIGLACNGVVLRQSAKDGKSVYPTKCFDCQVTIPRITDHLIGASDSQSPQGKLLTGISVDEEIARLDSATSEERWNFWKSEFDRCIKCYACRQICPHCFCEQCIVEKSTPQWISPCSSSKGNFSWNFIRAFHLVGRCVGCQECFRACPVGIRLDLVNRKMALEVKKDFDFEAGVDPGVKPPLVTYEMNDNQDFIR